MNIVSVAILLTFRDDREISIDKNRFLEMLWRKSIDLIRPYVA